jgi:hypothetical protein
MPKINDPMTTDSGPINPRALAEQLQIPLAELAELIGVSHSTLAAEPVGKKGREALIPLVRLLTQATAIAGSLERAVLWFKHTPIASIEAKTAMELVQDGNIALVHRHLEDAYNGV